MVFRLPDQVAPTFTTSVFQNVSSLICHQTVQFPEAPYDYRHATERIFRWLALVLVRLIVTRMEIVPCLYDIYVSEDIVLKLLLEVVCVDIVRFVCMKIVQKVVVEGFV